MSTLSEPEPAVDRGGPSRPGVFAAAAATLLPIAMPPQGNSAVEPAVADATPADVLKQLYEGNLRFTQGRALRRTGTWTGSAKSPPSRRRWPPSLAARTHGCRLRSSSTRGSATSSSPG